MTDGSERRARTDAEIVAYTIGAVGPLSVLIVLCDSDPEWPALFEREAARIRGILGSRVRLLELVARLLGARATGALHRRADAHPGVPAAPQAG